MHKNIHKQINTHIERQTQILTKRTNAFPHKIFRNASSSLQTNTHTNTQRDIHKYLLVEQMLSHTKYLDRHKLSFTNKHTHKHIERHTQILTSRTNAFPHKILGQAQAALLYKQTHTQTHRETYTNTY